MNYQKLFCRITFTTFLTLYSSLSFSELHPYKAVYSLISSGFEVADVTQSLEKKQDSWSISMLTEATGFASLLQSRPATHQELYSLSNNKLNLISSQSDSGKDNKGQYKATFDQHKKILTVNSNGKVSEIKTEHILFTYLNFPFMKSNILEKSQISVDFYDKGKIKKKIIHNKGQQEIHFNDQNINVNIYDIYTKNSNKLSRYYFRLDQPLVPVKIERLKNDDIKGYLLLKEFQQN